MHANLQLLPPGRPDGPQQEPSAGPDPDGNEFAQLLQALWRRRALMLLAWAIATTAVAAVAMRLPPSYRAEAVLLFAPADPPGHPPGDPTRAAAPTERPGDRRHLASEIELIRSHSLLTRVVQDAGLLYDPAFNPMLARAPGLLERLGLRAPPPPETLRLSRQRAATLAALRERLEVRPVGQSRALSLTVEAPTAAGAARAANAVAEVYLSRAQDRARDTRAAATAWLDRRVGDLRRRVQAADAAVADFRIESGLAERGPENAGTQRVGELNRALARARAEAADAQVRLRLLDAPGRGAGDPRTGNARTGNASTGDAAPVEVGTRDAGTGDPAADDPGAGSASARSQASAAHGDAGGLPASRVRSTELLSSRLLGDLRRQEADLERVRAQLATRHGPRHPRLVDANAELLGLRTRIGDELTRLAAGLRRDADLAQRRADALEAELRQVNAETGALGRAQVELAQLEREAAAERALFDSFLARLKETRVTADSPGARAELITPAQPPARPAAPNRPLLAGFGALAAAACAVALALLRDALDRGVRAPAQLQRLTGLRVLATIPRVRRDPAGRVVAQPAGALAEALRGLHTALLLGDLNQPPRTVLVTSALPGEGKTALACALARVLARAGSRVLLIDADLRHPRAARMLQLPATAGLGDLLARQCRLDAALYSDPAPEQDGRLTVLPAGRAGDPGRMLDSDALGRLIAELAPRYDIVLVDAPPVLAVADPRTLATRVDATLLTVRWARTPRASVQRAVTLLRDSGARIAGSALVQVDARQHARESSGYAPGLGGWRRYYAAT